MSDPQFTPIESPADLASTFAALPPGYVTFAHAEIEQVNKHLEILDHDLAMHIGLAGVLSVHGDEDVNSVGFYLLNTLNAINERLGKIGALLRTAA